MSLFKLSSDEQGLKLLERVKNIKKGMNVGMASRREACRHVIPELLKEKTPYPNETDNTHIKLDSYPRKQAEKLSQYITDFVFPIDTYWGRIRPVTEDQSEKAPTLKPLNEYVFNKYINNSILRAEFALACLDFAVQGAMCIERRYNKEIDKNITKRIPLDGNLAFMWNEYNIADQIVRTRMLPWRSCKELFPDITKSVVAAEYNQKPDKQIKLVEFQFPVTPETHRDGFKSILYIDETDELVEEEDMSWPNYHIAVWQRINGPDPTGTSPARANIHTIRMYQETAAAFTDGMIWRAKPLIFSDQISNLGATVLRPGMWYRGSNVSTVNMSAQPGSSSEDLAFLQTQIRQIFLVDDIPPADNVQRTKAEYDYRYGAFQSQYNSTAAELIRTLAEPYYEGILRDLLQNGQLDQFNLKINEKNELAVQNDPVELDVKSKLDEAQQYKISELKLNNFVILKDLRRNEYVTDEAMAPLNDANIVKNIAKGLGFRGDDKDGDFKKKVVQKQDQDNMMLSNYEAGNIPDATMSRYENEEGIIIDKA